MSDYKPPRRPPTFLITAAGYAYCAECVKLHRLTATPSCCNRNREFRSSVTTRRKKRHPDEQT